MAGLLSLPHGQLLWYPSAPCWDLAWNLGKAHHLAEASATGEASALPSLRAGGLFGITLNTQWLSLG
jgi:hypothetical protein